MTIVHIATSSSSSLELAVDRVNQALYGEDPPRGGPNLETLREWQTARRNLTLANAALSIANAKRIVDEDSISVNDE